MSDNIYNFPKKTLDIQVDLEDEEYHESVVDAVHTILEMHVSGIVATSDVEWEHVMDAALSVAISAGLRAGFPVEELQKSLSMVQIKDFEYDA
jgi:hypothetical protein